MLKVPAMEHIGFDPVRAYLRVSSPANIAELDPRVGYQYLAREDSDNSDSDRRCGPRKSERAFLFSPPFFLFSYMLINTLHCAKYNDRTVNINININSIILC